MLPGTLLAAALLAAAGGVAAAPLAAEEAPLAWRFVSGGRIIGALGRSGAEFDPDRVDIAFDDVVMVKDGLGQDTVTEERATQVLKQPRFTVTIDLKKGSSTCTFYTCDLTLDYVKINADYRT